MFFSDAELEAYVDEALPAERMAAIEEAARGDGRLLGRLAAVNARRDAGVHSLGEIWRRHRLTCPTREQLGSYLLNILPDENAAYIHFHLDDIGCRYCQANLADLESQQAERATTDLRRRKFFQSSAGYLGRKREAPSGSGLALLAALAAALFSRLCRYFRRSRPRPMPRI